MNDFTFSYPTKVYFGQGAAAKALAAELPGTGKTVMLAYYGVPPEQAVAIGDSEVDLGMIRQAGFGVAMGNAAAPVRQAADFVTASNNEEGVYLALKMLRFNPQKQERCRQK